MAYLKITEYRLAQDRNSGLIFFKVLNPDGSIGDPLGGKWRPIPFAAFSSLIGILNTGEPVYDPQQDMFAVVNAGRALAPLLNNEMELFSSIPSRKKKTKKSLVKKSNLKSKSIRK